MPKSKSFLEYTRNCGELFYIKRSGGLKEGLTQRGK